jgi:acyl transferase domain-containing protein
MVTFHVRQRRSLVRFHLRQCGVAGQAAAPDGVLRAVGMAYAAGLNPDWSGVLNGRVRLGDLPTYPFERQRHWGGLEPPDDHAVNGSHVSDAGSRSTVEPV